MTRPSEWVMRVLFCPGTFLLLALGAQHQASAFESAAVDVQRASFFAIWRALQPEIELDLEIVTRCRANFSNCASIAARRFIAIVDDGTKYQGVVRIGHINRSVNLALRPTPNDIPGAWTSSLRALADGAGDCKQYAVLKYVALIAAGYGPDRLHIVVVEDKALHRPHAVVLVREGERWLVLDNRSSRLVETVDFLKYHVLLGMLDRGGASMATL